MHALEAALPDQVDDQLQLVQALPVRDLGLVARLDERVEAVADQLRDAAAQHRLLAEEVALRLLRERRLEHPRARGAEFGAVRECELPPVAARVLRDGHERRRAVALLVEPANDVAGALRRDHHDVVALRRRDAAVVDVEAVREQERRARLEIRPDLLGVELRLHLVGDEDRDELRAADRIRDVAHRQAALLRRRARLAPRAEADLDLDAGVGEVERVGVALAAEPDHGDLAGEEADVAVLDHFCHRGFPFSLRDRGGAPRGTGAGPA